MLEDKDVQTIYYGQNRRTIEKQYILQANSIQQLMGI